MNPLNFECKECEAPRVSVQELPRQGQSTLSQPWQVCAGGLPQPEGWPQTATGRAVPRLQPGKEAIP